MAMIAAELVSSGEKRDARGRKLAGDARREAVLAAYDRSELTQREFARMEGVSYHTLVTWLMRRRRERALTSPASAVRFAEVRMPARSASLEVNLPNGIIVRGTDAVQMAALIKALR
jgi:DNA-binding transcriptional regulator YiaG